MRKWRIEGWLDGELTGEITTVEAGSEQRGGVAVAGDTDESGISGEHDVFEREPRWREFWDDTGEREPLGGDTGETEVLGEAGEAGAGAATTAARVDELAGVSSRRLWAWACVIALLGVAARVGWYLYFESDFEWRLGPYGMEYLGQAVSYMQGGIGNPEAGSQAPAWREMLPPGYALFLSGVFQPFGAQEAFAMGDGPMTAVRVVQWLMAGGVTLMTFALARRVLFGWVALVPAVLVTASIALVDLPSLLANETLLAFLLTAAVLLLVKANEAEGRDRVGLVVLAGLALSYAVLTQPRLVLVVPFAAVWLWRSVGARFGVALAILAVLLPAGWVVRNYAVFDRLVPVSPAGHASVYNDNVDPVGGTGTVERAAPPECPRSQLLSGALTQRFTWARCMQAAGFDEIAAHPADSALAVPDRFAALYSPWNPTRARGFYSTPHWDYHYLIPAETLSNETFKRVDRTLNYVWVAGYILLVLLGVLVLWAEGPRSGARIIALTLISLPLIHLVLHAENRFRVPFLPMAMIAVTLGAMTFWEALRRDSRS